MPFTCLTQGLTRGRCSLMFSTVQILTITIKVGTQASCDFPKHDVYFHISCPLVTWFLDTISYLAGSFESLGKRPFLRNPALACDRFLFC